MLIKIQFSKHHNCILVMLNVVFSDLRDTPEAEHVPGTGEETRVILNTTWSWSQAGVTKVPQNTLWGEILC